MYELDLLCFEPVFRFSRSAIRKLAEARGAITLVIESGQLIAFIIGQVQDQWVYIMTLDVDPAWRRRGLAHCLIAQLEFRSRAAGATAIGLHVFRENSGAIRFYEACGYNRTGFAENFYGRGLHALVYSKRLPA